MEEQQAYPNLDIIFELAREKLHLQSDQWNAIDQKNAVVLATYGIVLAIYLAADLEVYINRGPHIFALWILAISLGIACSILSLKPRTINLPPKIGSLAAKYLGKTDYDTKNVLLSTVEEAAKQNDRVLDRKTLYLAISINLCLPVSLGIAILSIIFDYIKGRM